MSTVQIQGKHYQTGKPVVIEVLDGIIAHVNEMTEREANDSNGTETNASESKLNTELPVIAPGFVDLQINGYAGLDYNGGSIAHEDVHEMTRRLWKVGVTAYYPTIITNSSEEIMKRASAIVAAMAENPLTAASIPGLHIEGPYISPEDGARGAHNVQFVKAPDWDEFQRWQDAAQGHIKILTLSPEWEGSAAFIEKCAASGVTVSIGHTAATSEQIREAVAAGARMCTHLGNGAHLMMPRHPNYIWEQLASDELWPCAIPDGFHLPEQVLKVFLKAKPEQLMFVSDAVYLAGMPPGEYDTHIGGNVVLNESGKLHLASNSKILAGSAQMLIEGIEYLLRSELCSLATAWELSSERPAKFMRLSAGRGLAVGAPADFVRFTEQAGSIIIQDVHKTGKRVYEKNES